MSNYPTKTGESDTLLQSIQESIRRLSSEPERVVQVVDEGVDKTRVAIRQLARSRIAQALKQLRAAQGLSYEHVHFRTGLAQQLLFDMEYKDQRLTLEELRKLAACYGVSVGDILGIELD